MGKKPLFGGMKDNLCSELKSIYQHPKWTQLQSSMPTKQYFELRYVPCPMTIDSYIQKLDPAHFMTIKPNQTYEKHCYWEFDQVANKRPTTLSTQDQQQWLREELTQTLQSLG